MPTDVFRHFGWDVEATRRHMLDGFVLKHFRNLLFQRVIPNVARIGLLTERVWPQFGALERTLNTAEAQ